MPEYVNDKGQTIYETENGTKVILNSVSPLFIQKLQSAGTLPDVPTRQVKLDLDGFEPTFQTEHLSEGDLQTAEEEKQWKEYVEERDAVLSKRQNNFMKAIFDKGTTIDIGDIEAWKEDLLYYELPIPTNPRDMKVEYIQTEVVKSADDMVGIITGVLGKSGVPQEELESVRASFRDSIRRRTIRAVEDPDREVEMERQLYPDESSALLESMAS